MKKKITDVQSEMKGLHESRWIYFNECKLLI